jgi:hypothetical protein
MQSIHHLQSAPQVTARMPTPLLWNARRDWQFDITMSRPVITLLRDHVTLISDLAKDWSSGPQGDFFHFTPYDYQFTVTLSHYQIKLYVNDFNVVDYPNRDDENGMSCIHNSKVFHPTARRIKLTLLTPRSLSNPIWRRLVLRDRSSCDQIPARIYDHTVLCPRIRYPSGYDFAWMAHAE